MEVIYVLLTIAAISAVVIVLIVGGIALTALSALWGTAVVTSDDPFKISSFIADHSVLFIVLIVFIIILGFFGWDYISCVAGNVFLVLIASVYFPNKWVTILLIGSSVLYGFVSKDMFTYKYAFETKNYKGMSSHVIRAGLYAELMTLLFCSATDYVNRFLMPHEDILKKSFLLSLGLFFLPMIVFLLISRFQKTFCRIDPIQVIDKNQSMAFRPLYYLFSIVRIGALAAVIYLIFTKQNSITEPKFFYGAIAACIIMLISSINTFKNVVTGQVYLNSWDE